MSDISKRIDAVAQNGLAQELKAARFRKTGRTWRRRVGSAIQVTNLQASSWNSGDSGRFTLNLAIYFPEVARLHGSFDLTETPLESDCIVRQRIGLLLPVGKDFWWEVEPTSNLELLGNQVATAWVNTALPWLDTHTDPIAAQRFLASLQRWWWCAIFSLTLGDKGEAKRFLGKAFEEAGSNSSVRGYLTSWQASVSL